jgi:hypothetical protein
VHLDIDELWYSPLAKVQAHGAPLFFAEVHPAVAEVSFRNHEAVPPPPPAGDELAGADACCFESVRLFKPHSAFTRGVAANEKRDREAEAARHARRCVGRGRSASDPDELSAWTEPLADNFDEVIRQVHTARSYRSMNGHSSAMEQLQGSMKTRLESRKVRSEGRDERRKRRERMRRSEDARAARQAAEESDESDQETRAERLADAQASAIEFRYFHAHEQGKAAVRLWPEQPRVPLPRAGIHRFTRISGDMHVCEGPGAPVILHYACSSFPAWLRKYEMLTTKPRFSQARQHSLGELPLSAGLPLIASGHAPTLGQDASLQATRLRHLDQLIPLHALAAQVIGSGERAAALQIYRHTICMPDALPILASHGLVLKVDHVAQLLSSLRQRAQTQSQKALNREPLGRSLARKLES